MFVALRCANSNAQLVTRRRLQRRLGNHMTEVVLQMRNETCPLTIVVMRTLIAPYFFKTAPPEMSRLNRL